MREWHGIVLVQPPFVQLNSPYPSLYYLKSFIEQLEKTRRDILIKNKQVTVLDHSIGLFERIFCRQGIKQIFSDAELSVGKRTDIKKPVRIIIERFLSEQELWLSSIERLTNFLRGKDNEWGHLLALANGSVPGGPRTDAYLSERGGEVSADETKRFATLLLSDIADFITATVDENFSLVRYRPLMEGSLNSGLRDFAVVEKNLDGYIMNSFYRPLLEDEWLKLEASDPFLKQDSAPFLLGLTIPFPGCLSGALVCAHSAKKHFGTNVRTIAGGGYVNTELRSMGKTAFSTYFDYVAFDKGYSALTDVLRGEEDVNAAHAKNKITEIEMKIKIQEELKSVETIFPDYSHVDFSRYLYPVDDANPMHRLWSDGHWLKAYVAYGCYWHLCAFCDVTLDYVKHFIPVDTDALFKHLYHQADQTGIRGIHFVDEAAPASYLIEFALFNRETNRPLNFWGNIRFEREFNPDTAAILAAGGLTGVSAGLEVATEKGLKRVGKGISLQGAVQTCAAFKEAGILTHAYLIYGYWDEDEQEIVDSAEILRQLFEQGLLDSAFWHKFVLTVHSRIYAEKKKGLHPDLVIHGEPDINASDTMFALNDLSFEGEDHFDKYTEPLEKLVSSWMHGATEIPVQSGFPFSVKAPSVPPNLVQTLLDDYIAKREAAKRVIPNKENPVGKMGSKVVFLGTSPRYALQSAAQSKAEKACTIHWRWKLTEHELSASSREAADKLMALLKAASRGKGMSAVQFYSALTEIFRGTTVNAVWIKLRESGLAVY